MLFIICWKGNTGIKKQDIVKTGPSLQSISRKDDQAEKKSVRWSCRWLSNEERGKHTIRGARHTLYLHEGSSCAGRQLAVWIRSKVECKFQNMLQHGGYLTEDKETSGNLRQQVWDKGKNPKFQGTFPSKIEISEHAPFLLLMITKMPT